MLLFYEFNLRFSVFHYIKIWPQKGKRVIILFFLLFLAISATKNKLQMYDFFRYKIQSKFKAKTTRKIQQMSIGSLFLHISLSCLCHQKTNSQSKLLHKRNQVRLNQKFFIKRNPLRCFRDIIRNINMNGFDHVNNVIFSSNY